MYWPGRKFGPAIETGSSFINLSSRRLIEFSEDVLTNVLAVVGGKKFQMLLYLFQQEFNRLKKMERSGGSAAEIAVFQFQLAGRIFGRLITPSENLSPQFKPAPKIFRSAASMLTPHGFACAESASG
jgi:hypothetical protein